jgi:hypothetical protein
VSSSINSRQKNIQGYTAFQSNGATSDEAGYEGIRFVWMPEYTGVTEENLIQNFLDVTDELQDIVQRVDKLGIGSVKSGSYIAALGRKGTYDGTAEALTAPPLDEGAFGTLGEHGPWRRTVRESVAERSGRGEGTSGDGPSVVHDDTAGPSYSVVPGFRTVGDTLPPQTPDPSPEERAAAMADTRRDAAAVKARLPIIIPESARVASFPYVVGHPDGRAWTTIPDTELDARSAGLTIDQQVLNDLMSEVLGEVSVAARAAAEETGISFTITPDQLNRALSLPLRSQLWYELSGEQFKDGLPSLTFDEHFMHRDLIGATSARTKPYDNLARTLAVLSQMLRQVPVDTDLAMPAAVNLALGRGGQGVTNLAGNKTGQFSNTLALTGGMETSYPIPVNDVWVGVMFGITDEQITSHQSLHEVMALYQIKLAERIRASGNAGTSVPHQPWHVQARLWVQLRSEDAGIDTTLPGRVEGNDYAGSGPASLP